MTLLTAHFPAGAYSGAKADLKDAWKKMGYSYAGGYTPRDASGREGQMQVSWVRAPSSSRPSRLGQQPPRITGFFNGSGAECRFEVDCDDEDADVMVALLEGYGASVALVKESTHPTPAPAPPPPSDDDFDQALMLARKQVEQGFGWPIREKGEPDLFFNKRMEKARADFDARVQARTMALLESRPSNGVPA